MMDNNTIKLCFNFSWKVSLEFRLYVTADNTHTNTITELSFPIDCVHHPLAKSFSFMYILLTIISQPSFTSLCLLLFDQKNCKNPFSFMNWCSVLLKENSKTAFSADQFVIVPFFAYGDTLTEIHYTQYTTHLYLVIINWRTRGLIIMIKYI